VMSAILRFTRLKGNGANIVSMKWRKPAGIASVRIVVIVAVAGTEDGIRIDRG
jgi:hypothetical protein